MLPSYAGPFFGIPCFWMSLTSSTMTMPVFVVLCHGFLVGRECLVMRLWIWAIHHLASWPVIISIQEPEPGCLLMTCRGLRFLSAFFFGLTFAIPVCLPYLTVSCESFLHPEKKVYWSAHL